LRRRARRTARHVGNHLGSAGNRAVRSGPTPESERIPSPPFFGIPCHCP
jgi:hypothetical protein